MTLLKMASMQQAEKFEFVVQAQDLGLRLDQFLVQQCPQFSRGKIQAWIKSGQVQLNQTVELKPKCKVHVDDLVVLQPVLETQTHAQAEAIALDIVFEDDSLLVVNKPAGLVVHPGAGNATGTLVNALLHHQPELENLPRAGIVHRLDKDTTGLLVVAKTLQAHTSLVQQLQDRQVKRQYLCIVHGVVTAGGCIDQPIGRHPTARVKMAVVKNGKQAVTHYRLKQVFKNFSFLQVRLETGRTHQIRVHMASIQHSLVGDPVYGGRAKLPKGAEENLIQALQHFKRQALHAEILGLIHPETQEYCEWQVEMPEAMQQLLDAIKKYNG